MINHNINDSRYRELLDAEAEVERLREALRPFAEFADRMDGHRGESPLWAVIDECRAARDVLRGVAPDDEED